MAGPLSSPPYSALPAAGVLQQHALRPPVVPLSPGIRHQAVVLRLASALLRHADASGQGHVLQAPCCALLDRHTALRPDILFVRRGRRGIIGKRSLHGVPDLAVEVFPRISPIEAPGRLKGECFRHGVPEFWAVDTRSRIIATLVWSELGYVRTGRFFGSDLLVSPLLPDFGLEVSRLFAPA
ncbi:MAG: Uma2 family endonuclease [Acidobacteria bacterium]|nr:Uma2 family endonuclease [Acidobacteriota bacterium]